MATTATVVGLVVGIVGSSANGIVLTVLVRARRQFGSSVHSLIVNQSAMDLFACFFAMISIVVMLRTARGTTTCRFWKLYFACCSEAVL